MDTTNMVSRVILSRIFSPSDLAILSPSDGRNDRSGIREIRKGIVYCPTDDSRNPDDHKSVHQRAVSLLNQAVNRGGNATRQVLQYIANEVLVPVADMASYFARNAINNTVRLPARIWNNPDAMCKAYTALAAIYFAHGIPFVYCDNSELPTKITHGIHKWYHTIRTEDGKASYITLFRPKDTEPLSAHGTDICENYEQVPVKKIVREKYKNEGAVYVDRRLVQDSLLDKEIVTLIGHEMASTAHHTYKKYDSDFDNAFKTGAVQILSNVECNIVNFFEDEVSSYPDTYQDYSPATEGLEQNEITFNFYARDKSTGEVIGFSQYLCYSGTDSSKASSSITVDNQVARILLPRDASFKNQGSVNLGLIYDLSLAKISTDFYKYFDSAANSEVKERCAAFEQSERSPTTVTEDYEKGTTTLLASMEPGYNTTKASTLKSTSVMPTVKTTVGRESYPSSSDPDFDNEQGSADKEATLAHDQEQDRAGGSTPSAGNHESTTVAPKNTTNLGSMIGFWLLGAGAICIMVAIISCVTCRVKKCGLFKKTESQPPRPSDPNTFNDSAEALEVQKQDNEISAFLEKVRSAEASSSEPIYIAMIDSLLNNAEEQSPKFRSSSDSRPPSLSSRKVKGEETSQTWV